MSSLLKRAIVASVIEHPDAEIYRRAAFGDNPAQLVEDLASKMVLTKADFFAADDKGKLFIDSPGAWRNFEKIAEIIQLGGEKFTYEDFTRPVLPSARTLLDSAVSHISVAKIFTADIWKGRFEEMEKLWYKVPTHERLSERFRGPEGLMPVALKRQVLATEGKEAPEDRLARAQLTLFDIRNTAAFESTFIDVNRKLAQAGDYFRKDYAMLPDSAGDTMFDRNFVRFETITKIMQAHGERFEVKDYLRQLSNRPSLLSRAAEHGALNKVFDAALWVDRLPDMLTLWSNVLDAWKRPPMTAQDFDNAYTEAEGLTYAKRFKVKPANGKADLLTPLNAGTNEKPVLPLGLKTVWDNFDAVKASLDKRGETLSLTDLRAVSGHRGDTILVNAAKFGHFDKVVDIAKQSGGSLTMEDFLTKDAHGNTLINILAEKRQLSSVFTVDAWTGQIADMRALWSHVAAAHRRQINFQQLETGVKQATLRNKANSGGFKPRPQ